MEGKKDVGLTVQQTKLRKQLQELSRILFSELHDTKSRLFGEIATVVEATIPEESRAKAVKDLVSSKIYGNSNMDRVIEHQIEQLAEANGFELYGAPDGNQLVAAVNQYMEIK